MKDVRPSHLQIKPENSNVSNQNPSVTLSHLELSSNQNILHATDFSFQVTPQKKVFSKEFTLYLKDSNAYGNTYFAKHFEWQGVMREAWFSECIFENMFALEGNFVTKAAHCDYKAPSYPFQTIIGSIAVSTMKHSSFDLLFTFKNKKNEEIISQGYQTIVYTDKHGKIIKLPQDIKFKMLAFVA